MNRRRWILASLILLAAVAAGVPFIKADGFAAPIRAALEGGLGRKVEINGPIRFSLIGRGFSIDQVVIHEDPSVGSEPFAYVTTLEGTLRLIPLLGGRFEFARLHLVEPSVNLAKARTGGWNAQPLLDQILANARGGAFPELSMSAGRLNFRLGEWKSSYYLGDAELKMDAASERELSLYIEGEPARTDRGLRGFGRFSGRGRVRLSPGQEPALDLNLNLTRSPVAELMMLAQGRGSNLEGFFSARASLTGPLSRLALRGRLQLEELERFSWLLGSAAGPGLDWEGTLNLPGQLIELQTSEPRAGLPLKARVRGSDLMGSPRWSVLANVNEAPAESVQPLVTELGFHIPGQFQWKGALSGAIGFDAGHGWNGEFSLNNGSVSAEGAEVASFDEVLVKVDSQRLQLLPANFRIPNQESVRLDGEYNSATASSQLRMHSAGVSLSHLKSLLPLLAEPRDLPLLNRGGAGRWTGTLWLAAGADGTPVWQADGEVRGMKLAVPGLAAELELERAALRWSPQELAVTSLVGRIGGMSLTAGFRENTGARRTQHLMVNIDTASAAKLETLLLPALRRRSGFLVRTLGIGANQLPEWMSGRRLQGEVRIAHLEADDSAAHNVFFRFYWQGASVVLSDISAQAGGGSITGGVEASLGGAEPSYRGRLFVHAMPWRQGILEGQAEMESAGTGAGFVRALRLHGSLRGRDLELGEGEKWDLADGCFTLSRGAAAWRWQFSQLQLDNGGEAMLGNGATGPDGRIAIELTAPAGSNRRLMGKVSGPAWEYVR